MPLGIQAISITMWLNRRLAVIEVVVSESARSDWGHGWTPKGVNIRSPDKAACDPVAVRQAEQFGIGGVFSH
jgi:hypothetical protein